MVKEKETIKKKAPAKKKAAAKTVKKEKVEKVKVVKPVEIEEVKEVETEEDFVVPERTGSEYYEGVGRRKTSVARVRLYNKKNGLVIVNGKKLEEYFTTETLQKTVMSPLDKMKSLDRFEIKVMVRGGGINSQSEAIRHGISRALVIFNGEYKKRLRKAGLLTRDSRMKERKKPGLKRARRAPQWSKR
jgi:small subunit ribosomal protein S9